MLRFLARRAGCIKFLMDIQEAILFTYGPGCKGQQQVGSNQISCQETLKSVKIRGAVVRNSHMKVQSCSSRKNSKRVV